jgi:hypothetical protein
MSSKNFILAAKALADLSYPEYIKAQPTYLPSNLFDNYTQYKEELEKYHNAMRIWIAAGEQRPRKEEEIRKHAQLVSVARAPVAPTPVLPTPVNPADPVAYDAYLLELEKLRDSLLEERDRLKREAEERRAKNAAGVHVLSGGRRKTRHYRSNHRSKKAKRGSSRRNRSV